MRQVHRSRWDASASSDSLTLPAGLYAVRVELADVITDEELRADLDADPFHWLLRFSPQLSQAASGRMTIDLTVPGPDVWTTTLTTMAALRQSGYGMHSLQVVTHEAHDQQSVA